MPDAIEYLIIGGVALGALAIWKSSQLIADGPIGSALGDAGNAPWMAVPVVGIPMFFNEIVGAFAGSDNTTTALQIASYEIALRRCQDRGIIRGDDSLAGARSKVMAALTDGRGFAWIRSDSRAAVYLELVKSRNQYGFDSSVTVGAAVNRLHAAFAKLFADLNNGEKAYVNNHLP